MANFFEKYNIQLPKPGASPQQPLETAPESSPLLPEQVDQPKTFFDKYNLGGLKPVEKPSLSLSKEQVIADPQKMDKIRNMMVVAKGIDYKKKPDEEVVDDFLAHMRWVNANEAYTANEAINVLSSSDREKATYGEAYQIYEDMGNIFTTGSWSDLASGIGDYTKATITSPSLWAGIGVGKALGRAGSVAGRKLIVDEITKSMTKKGLSEAVKKQTKNEVVKMAAKINGRKAVIGAAAIETTAALAQDSMYQKIMLDTGVQDDYSYLQTGASVLLSGLTSLSPLVFSRSSGKGVSGLGEVSEGIEKSKAVRKAKLKSSIKKELMPELAKKVADWEKLAASGNVLEPSREVRKEVLDFFVSPKNPNSFVNFLRRNGVDLRVEESGGFSRSLADFANNLDDDVRKAMDEALKPLNVTFGQVVEIFAATAKEAGENANLLSQGANAFYNNFKNVAIANKTASEGILGEGVGESAKKVVEKQHLGYIQSVWKRAIVSNVGTTVMNIKGWGIAEAAKAASEVVQVGLAFGDAGIRTLMGKSSEIPMGRVKALIGNLGYTTRMAVDPFTTLDGFYKLLEEAPKSIRGKVSAQFFQGVDNRGAEAFGLEGSKIAGAAEKYLGAAQKISFVNAQDVMTKSFSGIRELDKQVRLEHGMSLTKLVETGQHHLISEKAWEKAVLALQDTTFSRDFSKDKSLFGQWAGLIQRASNVPGLGFVFPFGQFVNSVVAFSYKYSPAAFIGVAGKIFKEGVSGDVQEDISKAIVGTAGIALAVSREEEKTKEGLQWFEERDRNGDVYKVDNVFPLSLYNVLGRIGASLRSGGGVPKSLVTDLGRQLALPAALEDAGDLNPIVGMAEYLNTAIGSGEELSIYNIIFDMLGGAGAAGAKLTSGFTRPFDALNDATGALGEMYGVIDTAAIDQKQLEGVDRIAFELTRYTDSFFKLLAGKEGPDGLTTGPRKFSATQEGPVKTGNPISSLFGHNVQQRRTNVDKLFAMVDKAPFTADSYKSGIPEFDNWMNEVVYPVLERKATQLLNNENFKSLSKASKERRVNEMVESARNEVMAQLERPIYGNSKEATLAARADLMARPELERGEAMALLGITKDISELNLFELKMIEEAMNLSDKKNRRKFGY